MSDPSSLSSARARLLRYGGALALTLLALWLRRSLSILLNPGLTYITFYPAVMVAALLGRLGPGLLATAASVLFAWKWLIPTRPESGADYAGHLAGLTLFAFMGVLMSLVAELYHRARAEKAGFEQELALKTLRQESDRRAAQELERQIATRTSEIEAQSRFLEALFQHSLDCFVILDRQFNFIRVNEAYARSCNRPVADFPGHNHFEFNPNAENQAIFENVVRTKAPFQITAKPFTFPDHPEWGVTYWDWTLVPILDDKGEVDFLVFSLRDLTGRRNAELALEQSETRYRSLVAASSQITWATDPAGKIVAPNPQWQEFTGQSFAECSGAGWLKAIHPADQPATGLAWERAVSSIGPYNTEYRLRRHDGQYRYVSVRGVPVREPGGPIREWVGTCTDITDRKEAERRRDFTNALLALFVQKSTVADYLNSVVEVIRQWSGCQALGIRIRNDKQEIPYEASTGFDPAFLELEGNLSLERDACCCIRAISGKYEPQDRALLTPGGSYRCDDSASLLPLAAEQRSRFRGNCSRFGFASIAVVPIRYRDEVIGAIHLADPRPALFTPETIEFIETMAPLIAEAIHRFNAETELAAYRDQLEVLVQKRTQELERSNRDLEQFAYVASHDLQEPLRAVAGFVRLLERRFPDQVDPKACEFISGAADGAARMERLITDLLAFSRVGTRGASFASTDLNLLFREAMQNLQASARAAQATITSDPLPTLIVDPTQVVQLLQNLVGNALKFRSDRPPRIHVIARRRQADWCFSVRDNGIGIERQYFERIFQIFQRLHTRRHYPGTGIGLAICKRIIERHGGEIWVESEPGVGATFYFTIPDNLAIKEPVI